MLKSNITIEIGKAEIETLKYGSDVLTTINSFAKEPDKKGGLFRKIEITVVLKGMSQKEDQTMDNGEVVAIIREKLAWHFVLSTIFQGFLTIIILLAIHS